MTDVYWLLKCYYLNLAWRQESTVAYLSCTEMGGVTGTDVKKDK